jgi:hypothetical protein
MHQLGSDFQPTKPLPYIVVGLESVAPHQFANSIPQFWGSMILKAPKIGGWGPPGPFIFRNLP